MERCFATVIYAAPRTSIEEMSKLKNHLKKFYGKNYIKKLEKEGE